MTSDRKHPTAAFWITVALVVVMVGYPLCFGPFVRCVQLGTLPESMELAGFSFFQPVVDFLSGGPPALVRPYQAYLRLWRIG